MAFLESIGGLALGLLGAALAAALACIGYPTSIRNPLICFANCFFLMIGRFLKRQGVPRASTGTPCLFVT